jgi:hypothetical protein
MMGYTDLFFREKLKIPVESFQPFRRLALPAAAEAQSAARNFPAWGVAVGAALQALPEVPVRINVLGALGRAQAQKGRNFPALVVAAMTGGALLLLPGLHGLWQATKLGDQLAAETQRVEEASLGLQKLEAENKKFNGTVQQMEMALALERERLRWPRLLQELKKHSTKGLWITGLKVLPAGEGESGAAAPGKPATPPFAAVEIEGMFETRSEKADAEGVANFQKALEAGGVLTQVTVLERETPQYVDGKTDQVALKFRLKAEWPLVASEKAPAAGAGK